MAAPAKPSIVVLGSGSFGTALGCVLGRNSHAVTILGRRQDVADSVNLLHRNPRCFSDVVLPDTVKATTDPASCLPSATHIVHTVPVQFSYDYLRELAHLIPPTAPIIVCSKGLHVTRLELMTDLVPAALGRTSNPIAALSGPTFAKELMAGWPTGAVVGCRDIALARELAALFSQPNFRPYVSTDLVGIEVAGALKNCYAIAAGAVEGIGFGANTTALLVTRAVAEMNVLATALGSTDPTLAGLAGVGDLMLTCWGAASRNRTVGVRLGKGEPLAAIMASMSEVAEGVATAPAALALARSKGLDHRVPIITAIVEVLQGQKDVRTALDELLLLPTGREHILDGVSLVSSSSAASATDSTGLHANTKVAGSSSGGAGSGSGHGQPQQTHGLAGAGLASSIPGASCSQWPAAAAAAGYNPATCGDTTATHAHQTGQGKYEPRLPELPPMAEALLPGLPMPMPTSMTSIPVTVTVDHTRGGSTFVNPMSRLNQPGERVHGHSHGQDGQGQGHVPGAGGHGAGHGASIVDVVPLPGGEEMLYLGPTVEKPTGARHVAAPVPSGSALPVSVPKQQAP